MKPLKCTSIQNNIQLRIFKKLPKQIKIIVQIPLSLKNYHFKLQKLLPVPHPHFAKIQNKNP